MILTLVMVERRASDPIMPLSIYSNRTVSVSLIAVFITGFAMFGSIIFIPLFFQGVLGASATSSGSFLTPMMLGMVVAAGLSGQALSRLGGHYRTQGLIGIATMGAGMVLISRMTADTSFGQAVASIVVTGLGLGITFPSFTIAVQNAVPPNLLGAATSATQFYRSVGGALGLAVLGSYMANRFATGLNDALPPAIRGALPEGQLTELANNPQALVNPEALDRLQAGFASRGAQGDEMVAQLLTALRETLGLSHRRRVHPGSRGACDCLRRDDLSKRSAVANATARGAELGSVSRGSFPGCTQPGPPDLPGGADVGGQSR